MQTLTTTLDDLIANINNGAFIRVDQNNSVIEVDRGEGKDIFAYAATEPFNYTLSNNFNCNIIGVKSVGNTGDKDLRYNPAGLRTISETLNNAVRARFGISLSVENLTFSERTAKALGLTNEGHPFARDRRFKPHQRFARKD